MTDTQVREPEVVKSNGEGVKPEVGNDKTHQAAPGAATTEVPKERKEGENK